MTAAPAATTVPAASPITFVVVHVRHTLQHAPAIGACSP